MKSNPFRLQNLMNRLKTRKALDEFANDDALGQIFPNGSLVR